MDKDSSSDQNDSSFLKRFLHFFGLNRTPDTAEDLEQEIHDILEEGKEQGLISSQEGQMINSIFEFRDTLASEIMTPRTEMVCVASTAATDEIIALITERGFTRIPVYSGSPDNIVGILHAKDLLQYCDCAKESSPPLAGEIVKPAFFAPETEKIVDLLKSFQSQKNHMAVITDEFGGIRGLVTLEDVLEEIVGEINDEFDKSERRWKIIDDYTLICDAKINVEEIETFFDIVLPEGPYESIGGFIIHRLGRVPEIGATTEYQFLTFKVIAATRRRIIVLKIQSKKTDE